MSDTERYGVRVMGLTHDRFGNGWGTFLEWEDEDGVTHQYNLLWELACSVEGRDQALCALADGGVRVPIKSEDREEFFRFFLSSGSRKRLLIEKE